MNWQIIISVQTGEVKEENRYFIISFTKDIKTFTDVVRKHWGVENNLHAPLDIVFKEDFNKTLKKNRAKNLRIIKNSISILKFVQTYYKISLNLIRTNLSFNFENEIDNIFKLLDVEKLSNLKHISFKNSCVYPDKILKVLDTWGRVYNLFINIIFRRKFIYG